MLQEISCWSTEGEEAPCLSFVVVTVSQMKKEEGYLMLCFADFAYRTAWPSV